MHTNEVFISSANRLFCLALVCLAVSNSTQKLFIKTYFDEVFRGDQKGPHDQLTRFLAVICFVC